MARVQAVRAVHAAGPKKGARRATALFVVMLAVAMDLVDTSAVNVALPSLQREFHMGDAGLQWLVAGYSLPFAAIFLLNVPVGAVPLVAASLLLPDGRSPGPARLDIRGTCLVVAGLGLLTLPLIQGPDLHWPLWTVVCLVGSVPVLLLVVHDQRTRPGAALVAKGLFGRRTFVSGLSLSLLVNAVMGGLVLCTTYTLQDGLGLSAVQAALSTLPMIVGMVLGVGVLVEPLIPRLGRYVITLGTAQTGSASGTLESVQQFGGVLGVVSVGGVFLHRADTDGSLGAFTWAAAAVLPLLAVTAAGAHLIPRHFRGDKELPSARQAFLPDATENAASGP